MRRAAELVLYWSVRTPYLLYLVFVLAPCGALAYGLAALARTVWANAVAGWKQHG